MTSIPALERRLDRLEKRMSDGPDIVGMALSTVSDEDLDVLQQASELNECGYTKAEIAVMMGERWPLYQEAAARFQEAAARIVAEMIRPQRAG